MKASQVLGIILAIALIAFGAAYPVPEKHLYTSNYSWIDYSWSSEWGEEYVGGDAYNYQMEASLKAGYMSGVLAMKSITFVGGLMLFLVTLYSRVKCVAIEKQNQLLTKIVNISDNQSRALERINESTNKQGTILNAISVAFERYTTPAEENNNEEQMV